MIQSNTLFFAAVVSRDKHEVQVITTMPRNIPSSFYILQTFLHVFTGHVTDIFYHHVLNLKSRTPKSKHPNIKIPKYNVFGPHSLNYSFPMEHSCSRCGSLQPLAAFQSGLRSLKTCS